MSVSIRVWRVEEDDDADTKRERDGAKRETRVVEREGYDPCLSLSRYVRRESRVTYDVFQRDVKKKTSTNMFSNVSIRPPARCAHATISPTTLLAAKVLSGHRTQDADGEATGYGDLPHASVCSEPGHGQVPFLVLSSQGQ